MTELPDPGEVSAVMDLAVENHILAQEQKVKARRVAEELKKMNTRNGFAPAIAFGVQKRNGGTHASA